MREDRGKREEGNGEREGHREELYAGVRGGAPRTRDCLNPGRTPEVPCYHVAVDHSAHV